MAEEEVESGDVNSGHQDFDNIKAKGLGRVTQGMSVDVEKKRSKERTMELSREHSLP